MEWCLAWDKNVEFQKNKMKCYFHKIIDAHKGGRGGDGGGGWVGSENYQKMGPL